MGMKYKDPSTGQLKELSLKAADTLPIGTIVDYDGEEVPEGWEEVPSNEPKILWTNPNPKKQFDEQTITLNSDDYDAYSIIFNEHTTEDLYYNNGLIPIGHGCRLEGGYGGAGGSATRSRQVDFTNNTRLTFQIGKIGIGTTAATTDNTVCVPIYIIGYKTGLFS